MKIDSKELIKIAWVLEVAILILYGLLILPWLDPKRIELFMRLIPMYGTLIGAQGLIAGVGPRIRAWQENQKAKIENGG